MASPLALSATARLDLVSLGDEAQPLVVADQALADVDLVRAIAARHQYQPIGPHYPGVRAAVSEAIAMPLVQPILADLQRVFDLSALPRYGECYLSLVTIAPHDLAPIQRLPHFDGLEPERIAVLLYLDPAESSGTGFYRQRATGFESVNAGRFAAYEAQLRADIAAFGMPSPAYIGGDSPLFEQFHRVDGGLNRMVAYRGNQLHCASLPDGFAPVADPSKGRLTLNLFLNG